MGSTTLFVRDASRSFDPWNAEKITQEIEEEYGVKRFAFGQTIGVKIF